MQPFGNNNETLLCNVKRLATKEYQFNPLDTTEPSFTISNLTFEKFNLSIGESAEFNVVFFGNTRKRISSATPILAGNSYGIIVSGADIINASTRMNFLESFYLFWNKPFNKKEAEKFLKRTNPTNVVLAINMPYMPSLNIIKEVAIENNKLETPFKVSMQVMPMEAIITQGFAYTEKEFTFNNNASLNVGAFSSNTEIEVPEFFQDHYISPQVASLFRLCYQKMLNGESINLQLTGKPGSGKTHLGQVLASWLGIRFIDVFAPAMADLLPEEWFTLRKAENGTTINELTDLGLAVLGDESHVVLIDESNRLPVNYMNSFFNMLDHRREIRFMGKTMRIQVPHIYIVTENRGKGMVGTQPRNDAAFENRFKSFNIEPLDKVQLAQVVSARTGIDQDIVSGLTDLVMSCDSALGSEMSLDITPRTIIEIVRDIVEFGMSFKDAMHFNILNQKFIANNRPVPEPIQAIIKKVK